MKAFFKIMLRTLDVDAARAFYAAVLGDVSLEIVPLHEVAIARGARPHWLGFVDVGDVERAAAAFLERGATQLAPTWVNPEGLQAAVMRDPAGAVVALAKPSERSTRFGPEVLWYLLHTNDVERARASYGELFGWAFDAPTDLGSHGVLHPFAWEPGGAPVGAMSDVSTRPGVPPHWLFNIRVASLDESVDAVLAGGGVVVGPFTLPSGARVAICDDPQGAAFAIRERL